MPKIIQFLHTAQEATPNNELDNIIPWNNNDTHRRKFILSNGKFINENDEQEESELVFWGEWEAQSEITRINKGNLNPPNYLNKPFINPTVPNRTHNTDPYVFGKNFRYIICLQRGKNFHNILTNLEPNSIILFGSSINGQFCLDTVFVVSEDKTNYTKNTIENLVQDRGQYYYASVNPIYDEFEYNKNVKEEESCRINDQGNYTFYKSVNFSERDKYHGLYSFVPCKVHDSQNFIFRQPEIMLDFINGSQTQGIHSKDCSLEEIVNYWKEIVKQIERKTFKKGVYFKTPELRAD